MATKERTLETNFGNNSAKKKKNETPILCKRRLVIALGCFAVGESVILVHLAVRLLNARESAMTPVQQRLCIPIENIPECSSDIESSDAPMCCDDASVILNKLVEMNTREIFKWRTASLFLSDAHCEPREKPVVATLHGINSKNMRKSESKGTVLWNVRSQLSVRHEVGHKYGRLHIKHSGNYYVYIQLTFHLDRHKTNSSYTNYTPESIQILLYHCSNKYNACILLIETFESICDSFLGNDVITSPVGAVFHLQHGDELFVQTSHTDCLLPNDNENIFGLYMI